MTDRERFFRIFSGEKVDRIPLYYFGTWYETKMIWQKQGISVDDCFVDYGPQLDGMDEDWEKGMWDCHGLVNIYPIANGQVEVVAEDSKTITKKYPTGAVVKTYKDSASVSYTIERALKPTRESWEKFKTYIDANDKTRYTPDLILKAKQLGDRSRVTTFMGGSLYGWLRDWLGIEELSILMYEDAPLLEEMLEYLTNYFIAIYRPFIKYCKFDFVYIFEDCCGSYGALFSPKIYDELYDKFYKKLINFYKVECGIPFVLLDSDGMVEHLLPCWIKSGVDIMFPIEVGKWGGNVESLRKLVGKNFCALGGIDKHKLKLPYNELKNYLVTLKNSVNDGKFLPIPDHRIPPEVTLEDMNRYIKAFNEVFNDVL